MNALRESAFIALVGIAFACMLAYGFEAEGALDDVKFNCFKQEVQ